MKKDIEALRRDVDELKALRDSRGFQIVKETIEREILAAAMQFADNPLMPEKEIDFRRGAIYACRNLLMSVDHLIQHRENDLLIALAEQQAQLPRNATA